MTAICCIDESFGLLFNNRRQSMDMEVRKKIYSLLNDNLLFMNEFSKKQFEENKKIVVSETPFESCSKKDLCFFENLSLLSHIDKVDKIILFKWNKKYPADFFLDFFPFENGWNLKEALDFAGSSHEKVTMEVYEK